MRGINLATQGHVVIALQPQSIVAETFTDVFNMKNHGHATLIVMVQDSNADAGNFKLQACDDFVPSNTSEIAFKYYAEETALGDTLGAIASGAVGTGIDMCPAGVDNAFYVVEVDASELPEGYPNLRGQFTIPGGAQHVACVAILTGARFAGDQNATAIA
jgi:hypothetical protein